MTRALIIADVQNDFCPGGALPVKEGDAVIPVINKIAYRFDKVVAVQDWHPDNHVSFARTHGRKPYEKITAGGIEQVLWPPHCVPGTWGAELHKDLDLRPVDLILRKGTDPDIDDYSAFLENDKKTETGLRYYLKGLKIDEVYICGLATDYCVYFSVLDSRSFGFRTFVVIDATRGIDVPAGNIRRTIADMEERDAKIITHEYV